MANPIFQIKKIGRTVAKDCLGKSNYEAVHTILHASKINGQLESLRKQIDQLKESLAAKNEALMRTTEEHQTLAEKLKESAGLNYELEKIHAGRLLNIIPVRQPLILISQIQRSGGTLLAQLLDGHPECLSYGHEIYIGHPDKSTWPKISLADGLETWWQTLKETAAERHFDKGFFKSSRSTNSDYDRFPFLLVPSLQKRIFCDALRETPPVEARDIFNAYMTSYFNAWIDYKNISGEQRKKYVSAFVPQMHQESKNIEQFFSIYPDGCFITIVRDPLNWYASAARHRATEYGDFRVAMQKWKASTRQSIALVQMYKSRSALIVFEDLVRNPEAVMRQLSDFLKLEYHPTMTIPTFNGISVKADSSFKVEQTGILSDVLTRGETLNSNQRINDDEAFLLYQEAIRQSCLK